MSAQLAPQLPVHVAQGYVFQYTYCVVLHLYVWCYVPLCTDCSLDYLPLYTLCWTKTGIMLFDVEAFVPQALLVSFYDVSALIFAVPHNTLIPLL